MASTTANDSQIHSNTRKYDQGRIDQNSSFLARVAVKSINQSAEERM